MTLVQSAGRAGELAVSPSPNPAPLLQLKQEANKGPQFLKQCVALFKSPQAPIRQQAVWFAGALSPRSLCPCPGVLQTARVPGPRRGPTVLCWVAAL